MRDKWKRWLVELLVVVVALLALRSYQTRSHPSGIAPEFEARGLNGEPLLVGGEGGPPTVLHFWATWCGVCRASEGNVVSASKNVRVVSVASRSGPSSEVAAYVKANGIPYPVINDPAGSLAKRFGVAAYPTTFFISREGAIVTSEVGYTTYLGLVLRAFFAGL